ncbi:MAG: hypothetical protein Kow0098_00380 [Ignavibacteriaceae bacterium]
MKNKAKKNKPTRSVFHKTVNVFLYAGLVILIIFILLIGFTQTSTFREYLRETLLTELNAAINGKLSIERIDGTILSSVELINTTVTQNDNILFSAESIELRFSPLRLLLKTIYIRKFEILNASLNLTTDSSGTLNIVNLFPPSESSDTAGSEFPFKIQVADFRLTAFNFSHKVFGNSGETDFYSSLNTDDIKLSDINLHLNALADISENDFLVNIDDLSFDTNIQEFSVKRLTGGFKTIDGELSAENLSLITTRSDILINARLLNYDPFDSLYSDISKANIDFQLNAYPLSFTDLSAILPETGILGGSINAEISAAGNFKKLLVENLKIAADKTIISGFASVSDIDQPQLMHISALFANSEVSLKDVNDLINGAEIPVYEQYGLIKLDTLKYEGTPLVFTAEAKVSTDRGRLTLNNKFNFKKSPFSYEGYIKTYSLDLLPVIGISTSLNLNGKIIGSGTEPSDMNTLISFTSHRSRFQKLNIDSLSVTLSAKDTIIGFNFSLLSEKSQLKLNGTSDFKNFRSPSFNIEGIAKHIDLMQLTSDSSSISDLNFTFEAEGKNFDPDSLNLFMNLKLTNSTLGGVTIDSTRLIADLFTTGEERVINVISDIADITLSGKFSLIPTISLVAGQADAITNSFVKLASDLIGTGGKEMYPVSASDNFYAEDSDYSALDSITQISYLIDLKDFKIVSMFLGEGNLEIDGELSGKFRKESDSINIRNVTDIAYVKYWNNNEAFFISGTELELNLFKNLYINDLSGIKTELRLNSERIYAGTDIIDLKIDFAMNQSNSELELSGKVADKFSVNLKTAIGLYDDSVHIAFDDLILSYNKFQLKNKTPLLIELDPETIKFRDFRLYRNGEGIIELTGELKKNGKQDIRLDLINFRGKDVAENLLGMAPFKSPDADIRLVSSLRGTFADPQAELSIEIDSINYASRYFGSLRSLISYKNNKADLDIKFIDDLTAATELAFSLTGSVHYPIVSGTESETLPEDEIDLVLNAEKFDLSVLGSMLPGVKNLSGILKSNLIISGKIDSPEFSGEILVNDIWFTAVANGLRYSASLGILLDGNKIHLDSLYLRNEDRVKDGGILLASGEMILDNLSISSAFFNVKGTLKVLDNISKSSSPSVYGDLVIQTNDIVTLRVQPGEIFLKAPIKVKKADLTFPMTQSAYENTLDNFIYKYVSYDNPQDSISADFDEILKRIESDENQIGTNSSGFVFDYLISINVDEEARMNIVLSKEFNQYLTAILKGDFEYEMVRGRQIVRGELNLVEGSSLDFLKTFQADGSIRFENELSDPYLNITATYNDYYYPADSTQSGPEVPVAVKVKLSGLLSELHKNFIKDENNIAVYYGQYNIDNDLPDPSKDATDAIFFILTGKFTEGVTQQDRNAAASTATSIAGSIFSGFLNQQFGDYVRSVQFRQVGSTTRFSLIGKAGSFRYEIGGSTDVFQDLSNANVKIEYPLVDRLLLRLERKEAISETNISNEMINELGLKYRFEF